MDKTEFDKYWNEYVKRGDITALQEIVKRINFVQMPECVNVV